MLENSFEEIWHWKIFALEGRQILVSNITIAILALILGLVIYKRLISKTFDFVINKKFKKNAKDFYLLRQMIGYILLIIYFCFILSIANIPFTIFAFLSGAIAISLGLGAQNFINDFINGFLVIMDKSVNVGDVIKIDNILGRIEEIGIRHTKIRTCENTELIIPNNSIISSKLTKYSSEKSFLRSKIYLKIENKTFNTNDIEKKIKEALCSIPEISEVIPPELYFIEIAQKTYKYQLNYYPKDFGKYNREYVQNLVNHKLIELMPNIEIKLPQ